MCCRTRSAVRGDCLKSPEEALAKGLHFMRVHSCVEEPGGNENGHEGVCAFRFLLDNYEKPWQHVFFLHGDANTPHHVLVSSELTRYLKRNEWPVWPARYADIKKEHCGCKLMTDAYPSRDRALFGPKDFWFTHITWWGRCCGRDPAAALAERWRPAARARGRLLAYGHGAYVLHNGSLASPMSYMFSVDRRSAPSARRLPRGELSHVRGRALAGGRDERRAARRAPAPTRL